jgi:hypothetical protein
MKTAYSQTPIQWNVRSGLHSLSQWLWPFGRQASFAVSPGVAVDQTEARTTLHRPKKRAFHLTKALRYGLMVPVLPLAGYFLLDATGLTNLIIGHNTILARIIGEGFGHAGMCFSLHYVFQSGKHFWKSVQLF